MAQNQDMARDLLGCWRKRIWRPFMAAIKEYQLVEAGDRIAVCVSGGKDSMLLAKCMQALERHSPLDFELRFICMDPGYTKENRIKIEENAHELDIPLLFFETDIFAAIDEMGCNPCFMCAKMRRGYLYRYAQSLSCNKIALGHHFDDVVETLLISMLYAGQLRGMRPRIHSDSLPGMQLIRPLYKVKENDIVAWRDHYGLQFLDCACRVVQRAELRADGSSDSKRQEIKQLVKRLNEMNPNASANIFRSSHNAILDSLNGWKHQNQSHSLLEEFIED